MADIIKKVNALGLLDQYTIAKSLGQEGEFCKSFGINIEKGGKAAAIGEIREFGGKKYQKQANGWRPVKKGDQKAGKESEEGDKDKFLNKIVSFGKDGTKYTVDSIVNGKVKLEQVGDENIGVMKTQIIDFDKLKNYATIHENSKLDLSKHSKQELLDAMTARAKSGVSESDPEMKQLQAELDKRGNEKEVEHKSDLKEGEEVRTAGGKMQRVVSITGNLVRVSGESNPIHISKLYRPNGEAVISEKKSSTGTHIGDMSKEQKFAAAAKFGIANPEKLSTKELDKQLVDKNIEAELKKFKESKGATEEVKITLDKTGNPDFAEYTKPNFVEITMSNGKKLKFSEKNIQGGQKVYQAILQGLDNYRDSEKAKNFIDRLVDVAAKNLDK